MLESWDAWKTFEEDGEIWGMGLREHMLTGETYQPNVLVLPIWPKEILDLQQSGMEGCGWREAEAEAERTRPADTMENKYLTAK